MRTAKSPKLGSNTSKERKKLIKECDDLTSQIVRLRDGRCVCCGTTERLTDGHLITRGCHIIRWDLTNNNCQCSGCNFLHEHRPERYTNWWINHYGKEAYDNLVEKSRQTKHWGVLELREEKFKLKNKLDELLKLKVDQE